MTNPRSSSATASPCSPATWMTCGRSSRAGCARSCPSTRPKCAAWTCCPAWQTASSLPKRRAWPRSSCFTARENRVARCHSVFSSAGMAGTFPLQSYATACKEADMDLGLKGKRALVASSSRGLGFATALGLAKEGCKVVINSRTDENVKQAAHRIASETGAQVMGIPGDVSDPAVPGRLVEEAVKFLGGLDLLVTNAGGPPSGAFEAFDEAAWEKAVNLSFLSHVRLIRAALPYLRKSDAHS